MENEYITKEKYKELVEKHNQLCQMLDIINKNPLADYSVFEVEEIEEVENQVIPEGNPKEL